MNASNGYYLILYAFLSLSEAQLDIFVNFCGTTVTKLPDIFYFSVLRQCGCTNSEENVLNIKMLQFTILMYNSIMLTEYITSQ